MRGRLSNLERKARDAAEVCPGCGLQHADAVLVVCWDPDAALPDAICDCALCGCHGAVADLLRFAPPDPDPGEPAGKPAARRRSSPKRPAGTRRKTA